MTKLGGGPEVSATGDQEAREKQIPLVARDDKKGTARVEGTPGPTRNREQRPVTRRQEESRSLSLLGMTKLGGGRNPRTGLPDGEPGSTHRGRTATTLTRRKAARLGRTGP